jgi:hypothetical protein
MQIETLYPRVTEAIRRAEALESTNPDAAQSAYLDVSFLEERISRILPPTDPEGAIARRGAVRAAISARDFLRARKLASKFFVEAGVDESLKSDLEELIKRLPEARQSNDENNRLTAAASSEKSPTIHSQIWNAFFESILGWLSRDPAPKIPDQKPATIETVLENGRIMLRSGIEASVDDEGLTTALSNLRSEIRAFEASAEKTNVNKDLLAYIQRLGNEIPSERPSQDELFRLGHAQLLLQACSNSIDSEWPDSLATRYHALLNSTESVIRHSPRWSTFVRDATNAPMAPAQEAQITNAVLALVAALRNDYAREIVDPAISYKLEEQLEYESVNREGLDRTINIPLEQFEITKALIAQDALESVNNVLKILAEAAIAAKKNRDASYDAARVFIVTSSAPTVRLAEAFPSTFSWLNQVMRFILVAR